jgi:hypothetical protein
MTKVVATHQIKKNDLEKQRLVTLALFITLKLLQICQTWIMAMVSKLQNIFLKPHYS